MKLKPYPKEGIFIISVDNSSQLCSIEEIEEWLQEVKNGSNRTLYLDKRKTAKVSKKQQELSKGNEYADELYQMQQLQGLECET